MLIGFVGGPSRRWQRGRDGEDQLVRERGGRDKEEEPCDANRLHVVDAVFDGDLGEGDAGRGGFSGGKHACEV